MMFKPCCLLHKEASLGPSSKFHYYLYGANFTVRTDNNLLTYVLTIALMPQASCTAHFSINLAVKTLMKTCCLEVIRQRMDG